MPRCTLFRSLFLAAAALPAVLGLALLLPTVPPARAQKNKYPAPPSGTARVIARKVQNDAGGVEWRWTLLTERYYSSTSSDSGGSFTLSGGDDALHPDGGVGVYDLRIRVEPAKNTEGGPRVSVDSSIRQQDTVFRRSDGTRISRNNTNSRGSGDDPLPKPTAPDKVARALFTGDRTFSLPIKLALFERTVGQERTGHRLVSYLTISK